MLCSFSNLDNASLEAIQSLEKDLGKMLLSFSCQDIEPADIGAEELAKIGELENKLGVVLVAVE